MIVRFRRAKTKSFSRARALSLTRKFFQCFPSIGIDQHWWNKIKSARHGEKRGKKFFFSSHSATFINSSTGFIFRAEFNIVLVKRISNKDINFLWVEERKPLWFCFKHVNFYSTQRTFADEFSRVDIFPADRGRLRYLACESRVVPKRASSAFCKIKHQHRAGVFLTILQNQPSRKNFWSFYFEKLPCDRTQKKNIVSRAAWGVAIRTAGRNSTLGATTFALAFSKHQN